MARRKRIGLREALTSLLPRRQLNKLAAQAGLQKRQRKVRAHALFWTLVLGFGTGRDRTLASLRRAYKLAGGGRLAPSAFYARFTTALVRWLKKVLGVLIERAAEPVRALQGPLAAFKDLLLTDSTVIRLHEMLAPIFPGCRTNHTKAALKMHVVFSATGSGPRSIRVTSERTHDGPVLRVGQWLKDRLLLMDLGYFRYQLFSCIRRNGGYFIVRLKQNANPLVVAAHRFWRGRSVPLVDRRIRDVLGSLRRQVVDVEVDLGFQRRAYGGKRRRDHERFRLVGVRDQKTGAYHLYLTNIPPEKLSAEDIAQTYAARWAIELLFRELKSRYRAEDMPSRKRVVVEALVYAVLITLIVSRHLLAALRAKLGLLGRRVPVERWAILFAAVARDLLRVVLRRSSDIAALLRSVEDTLLDEAIDPNVSRKLLLERVESRTQFRDRYLVGEAYA